MMFYDRIGINEGIDVNNIEDKKECIVCHC